jgi:hypothetical protein
MGATIHCIVISYEKDTVIVVHTARSLVFAQDTHHFSQVGLESSTHIRYFLKLSSRTMHAPCVSHKTCWCREDCDQRMQHVGLFVLVPSGTSCTKTGEQVVALPSSRQQCITGQARPIYHAWRSASRHHQSSVNIVYKVYHIVLERLPVRSHKRDSSSLNHNLSQNRNVRIAQPDYVSASSDSI